MQRAAMLRSTALVCSTLLLGCTLVDQRTFNPRAGMAPPGPPGPSPIVPLVSIDLSKPHPDYAAALHQAVSEALARKPTVEFDVVSVVPAAGTTQEQVAAATGIVGDAREIARAINADGVDDGRIHLSARAEPDAATRQVQVFIR